MKLKFANALSLALIMAMLFTSIGMASSVDVAVVDVVVPTGSVTLAPGASGNITINMTVTGNQVGTATFEVNRDWTLSGGVFTGSNPQQFTVNPRSAGDPATTFSTSGTVTVASGQAPGGPFTLAISAFDITNSNDTGAKLADGADSNYKVTVSPPADSTPPSITPNVSGTLGNNGWYTSNVTISWTVSDPQSTVTSTSGCGTSNINTDTTGTTFTCSATSAGGPNSQSVTIKRDATAPSISGSAAPAPNSAGWNNTDVVATFSCSDATSGIASCTAPNTLSSNGAAQSASGTAVDAAGNSASTTVSNINIDKELPTINASVPAANGNGWYNGSVTATFNCTDGYSGIASCEGPHTFTNEGSSSFTGHASDVAENANTTNVSVNIDATAPVIALVSRTPANGNGWNKGNVVLEWSCTDTGSGVVDATITKTVSDEGAGQSESATCEDLAGNTSSDTETDINIDTTAPTINAGRAPAANTFGWNKTDVTASYNASDALSGLASSATGSFVFSSEGAGQSHTFTVTDLAGNSASATVDDVNIDKTSPTVSGAADRAANGNGWYDADVTVSFNCGDALSGVDTCSGPSTLEEGAAQSVTGTATDKAGNSASATVSDINIDETAPTASASASPAANVNGWNNSNVTVTFSGSDALSGIDFCDAAVVLNSEGVGQSASGTCTDEAGNVSAPATASGINIDKTAPTATASASPAPNANGWNKTDVTVTFNGNDGIGSGVDFCDAPVVLSAEAAGQSASGDCTDKAGNVSASATASNISIDKTAPTVSLVGGPANGGTYYFGFVPAAPTCSANDFLSGLDGSCLVSGYGATVGTHTVSANATDKAGNSAGASATYTVNYWTLTGFYQPVDMTAGVWNTVKNGQTVPLKFNVYAGLVGQNEQTNTSAIKSFTVGVVSCGAFSGAEDPVDFVTTGGTSLRYDTTAHQFIQNWQTPKGAGICYKVTMTTTDLSTIIAYFKTK